MRKANKTLRAMGYAAPVALTLALAVPAMGHEPTDKNLWSADGEKVNPWPWLEVYGREDRREERTAWVNSAGECWQSKTGAGNLAPCAVAPEPPKVVELNFKHDQYAIPDGIDDMRQVEELDEYIDQLLAAPTRERITIVGHTSADGSDAYNMKLGQDRAEAVRNYLIRRGYPVEKLAPAESRGEYELRPEFDPLSVAQRRVEFHKTRL